MTAQESVRTRHLVILREAVLAIQHARAYERWLIAVDAQAGARVRTYTGRRGARGRFVPRAA